MVTTRRTAKNGGTAAAALDANTPALRAAQRELKAKAILSVRLAKLEPIITKIVQTRKLVVEDLASAIRKLDEGESGNFRRECVRRGLELVHHQTINLSSPGTCGLAWGTTAIALGIYENMVKNKEKMEKEWKRLSEHLRLVRERRKCAIRCVKVLKACLVEVRRRQQTKNRRLVAASKERENLGDV